ncbi:MAG: VCBS repeat-containing protein [Acidobacteria bacterium]|nr:VCBS repeat-containing protein [Acidobacteriota bacterium]
MPEDSRLPSIPTLTSWKEIARFFDREVRTVQLWEKEEGLPVHRHLHRRQSSVYAYPEELTAWWEERGAMLSVDPVAPPRARWRSWVWLGVATATLALVGLAFWLGRRATAPPAARSLQTVLYRGARPNGYLDLGLLGDLNGDGKDDAVFTAPAAREIYVMLGGRMLSGGGALPDTADVIIRGTDNASFYAQQAADFNGDGIKDLLVAEVLEEPDMFHRTGPTFILWGRRQWPKSLTLPHDADVTFRLDWSSDVRMGGCPPGKWTDLNGDGIDDVLLGANEYGPPDRRSSGSVFILYGRRAWPRELEVASSANVILRGSRTGEGFAGPCAAGDFNGDGRVDLAIGASEWPLWKLLGARGRTYVFLGRGAWPRSLEAERDADFRVDGLRPNALSQQVILADLNGDGRDDLILAASRLQDNPAYAGEVAIFFGGSQHKGAVPLNAADVVISGTAPGAALGSALLASDLDNDGMKDLLVSEPGLGRIVVLYGRREWPRSRELSEFGAVELFRAERGTGLTQIRDGDFDGDALEEIIFAAPNGGPPFAASEGHAWVLKPYLISQLDVRPGNEPNVIYYPDGICVARLYGLSWGARDLVDPSSVRLAGAPATRFLGQDYNGDGITDLQLYFDTAPMRLSPNTKRIALTARTRSGLLVGGSDEVILMDTRTSSSKPKSRTLHIAHH